MPPELQPDVWPWEWLWFVAVAVALVIIASLVVRFVRQGGFKGPQPWIRWIGLGLSLLLVALPFVLYNNWISQLTRTQSVTETSSQSTNPNLHTRVFPLPANYVFAEAVRVVQNTPTWRLTRQDPDAGVVSAEVSVALGLFTNDILIQIGSIAPTGTQVDVRASARRPEGDLGTTEREIAIFYRRLEQTLNNPGQ